MTLWLVHSHHGTKRRHDGHAGFDARRRECRLDLDANPSPTVTAAGVWAGSRDCTWIEETDGMEPERTAAAKPRYRVPLMSELDLVEPNDLVVASTFSGGGGSCLGYRMAGFRVAWANEFVPAAQDTYRANFPSTVLDGRDIRTIRPSEVLDALGMTEGELDLFDGSPPCQSFSTAGRREKGWGQVSSHGDGSRQRSDDLFFEYARLLRGIRPRVFIAENVSGLVKGTARGYFREIHAALADCGYRVEARVLDAQWCGVPQHRDRVIFQGVRDDLGFAPAWPAPLPYRYTVRDALWDITPGLVGQITGNDAFRPVYGGVDQPSPTILSSVSMAGRTTGAVEVSRVYPPDRNTGRAPGRAPGEDITDGPSPTITTLGLGNGYRVDVETRQVPVEDEAWRWTERGGAVVDRLKPDRRGIPGATSYFGMRRLDWDKPAGTVQASEGQMPSTNQVHPVERRRLSIAELRRICSFPDDFVLMGSYAEQWARLGNSVPPLMMRHVARGVAAALLAHDG